MMDSPFFGSPSLRSYSNPFEVTPVHRAHGEAAQKPARKPKIVRIPVHFVGSEPELNRSDSAMKIQKVFRRFLVRKSVKKIISIRKEVEEIERRISQIEFLDLVQRDERERLRVNEALMALVIKLDTIRGDSAVRDCRKAVIKKAIALQENVDAIVSSNAQTQTFGQAENHEDVTDKEKHEQELEALAEEAEQTEGTTNSAEKSSTVVEEADQIQEINSTENPSLAVEETDHIFGIEDAAVNLDNSGDRSLHYSENRPNEIPDFEVDSEVKTNRENCVDKEIVDSCNQTTSEIECLGETVEMNPTENKLQDGSIEVEKPKQTREDGKRDRELLERMMEDNGKMMSLMTHLVERNEMQTRMLNALAFRVEQLEKAFICDRLRKKKKK